MGGLTRQKNRKGDSTKLLAFSGKITRFKGRLTRTGSFNEQLRICCFLGVAENLDISDVFDRGEFISKASDLIEYLAMLS